MIKKKDAILIIFSGVILHCSCLPLMEHTAGVFYPKTFFEFHNICEEPHGCPPFAIDDRLNAGATYPQTFDILIGRGSSNNSFNMSFWAHIFVNKPYNFLHIKEMSCEWDGNMYIFLKKQHFRLSKEGFDSMDNWYLYSWLNYFFEFNPEKLFTDKKPGDEFKLYLTLVYSFDDEPENTQILEYNVKVLKGRYVSFFIGWGV